MLAATRKGNGDRPSPITRYRRSAWRQTRRVPRPAFLNANRKTQRISLATMAGDSSRLGSGSKGGRELRSCSGTSGERLDCSGFVFLDIEHAVQFGGFQQIEDVDRRLQQLDIGSLIARSRQRTNELPDARTVDVGHACKVE